MAFDGKTEEDYLDSLLKSADTYTHAEKEDNQDISDGLSDISEATIAAAGDTEELNIEDFNIGDLGIGDIPSVSEDDEEVSDVQNASDMFDMPDMSDIGLDMSSLEDIGISDVGMASEENEGTTDISDFGLDMSALEELGISDVGMASEENEEITDISDFGLDMSSLEELGISDVGMASEENEETTDISDFGLDMSALEALGIGDVGMAPESNGEAPTDEEPDYFSEFAASGDLFSTSATESAEEDIFAQFAIPDGADLFGQAEPKEESASASTDMFDQFSDMGLFADASTDGSNGMQDGDIDPDLLSAIGELEGKGKKKKKKGAVKNKVKDFLVEQGEDTEADIAAAEEKAVAKAEKENIKAEKKAEREEAKAKKQAEQAEANKIKEEERKAKKAEKKATKDFENSQEPKYKVTIVKVILLLTIVAAVGIIIWALTDFNHRRLVRKNANSYFLNGQYELAYEEIQELRPDETEDELYEQIRTIMYIVKQYNSYLNFYNIDMKEEALDALIKGVDKYDKYYTNAVELGITDDMDYVLGKITEELYDAYGISLEKARAISNIEDPVEYSIEIRKIVVN